MYPVNRRKFMARGLMALGAGALASAVPGLSQAYADIDYPKRPRSFSAAPAISCSTRRCRPSNCTIR
jgi:hypothetical protein